MREEGSKETEEVVADALGAAFGDFLAENHGFRWVAVTDQYGTEYAVRHEIGDTTAFPRASVQKRIERRDTDFFRGITLTILDQLRRRGESQ
jgi:hypothetical protein